MCYSALGYNMSKKIAFKDLCIVVPAQTATAGGSIATTLGSKLQVGVFIKQVNDATKNYDKGSPVRLKLDIYGDRTFDMRVLGNTTRYKILKAANLTQGSSKPGQEIKGSISLSALKQIAKEQSEVMRNPSLLKAMATVESTATSMGITVHENTGSHSHARG